ncbi:helicase-related protein [Maricaulis sp. CAU 1757]
MLKLEEIVEGISVEGLSPHGVALVKSVKWLGSDRVEVVYKDNKRLDERIITRDEEGLLSSGSATRPFALNGDAEDFRLAAEARRIRLAHLFDPYLALTSAAIEPLPHQITAVYGEMLPRQPLRFLLADDPGAGKTIMAGLLIKELALRGDLQRCMIVAPGSLVEQWQDELQEKFDLGFEIVTREMIDASYGGNPFTSHDRLIMRLDMAARSEELQEKIRAAADFDLIICDEAHRMSASYFGNEAKFTKRFRLGKFLGEQTRNLLLMTATPHNGKEEDFQLFLSLLDADRFEGKFREGMRGADPSDLMRRLVKEELYWFDGRPLFPERVAKTVSYKLSPAEAALYTAVTDYVREEMNRADNIEEGGGRRRNNVGFALQTLQRRLASSPRAIWRSLKRRKERLETRLDEERIRSQGGGSLNLNPSTRIPDDLDDLEDMSEEEREAMEEDAIDQASSARTLAELEAEISSLKILEEQAYAVCQSGEDTKWSQLASILDQPPVYDPVEGKQKKVLIFTEPKDTLEYLQEKITARIGDPNAVRVIHGGVPRQHRRAAVAAFNDDPEVRVLIANDAAGEGVNLQRGSHLMINYDLPWNPNRLEQRFGRIHRIGQTEVCHLFNLVAGETREGQVYERLLEKLEEARKALKGKVYDVLGELFEQKSLNDLLFEAVRYGDDPAVRERLQIAVDGAVNREHIEELSRRAQLSMESLSVGDVEKLRLEMERASAERLQPHYVRQFFQEAFRRLGGVMEERETGRYEILRVPASVRAHDQHTGSGDPVLERYERVCFDKAHRGKEPQAALIAPGHPLLEAVLDLTLQNYGLALQQGTVLVNEIDPGIEPQLLVMAEHEVTDGRLAPNGAARSVSRRMDFVLMNERGKAKSAGAAPYLDLRPLEDGEEALVASLLEAGWLTGDLAERARAFVAEHLVAKHLEQIKARRLEHLEKVEREVRYRLGKEIRFWDNRIAKHDTAIRAGKDETLPKRKAQERVDRLTNRLDQRLAEIEKERALSARAPEVCGGALVVPSGLLARLKGEDGGPEGMAEDTSISEKIGMDAVMDAERAAGRTPVDVSHLNRGWDIESFTSDNRMLMLEVKARVVGGKEIFVTKNEMLQARNAGEQYHLVVVPVEDGFAQQPVYITDPASRFWDQGDFKDTKRAFLVRDLVAQGAAEPKLPS